MTHALLTGAAGFVGSHVLRHLLANTDWTLSCPVSFRHKGMPERVEVAIEDHPGWRARIDVVRCDLAAPLTATTRRLLGADRTEYLFNLASQSHVDRSVVDPVPFVENNIALMLNVLEAARQMPNLRALLQVSTDEVYGPAPDGHQHREWEPVVPSNPYSASKAAQEAIAISYWRTFGVPLVLTNTMNIIGETQDPEKFVPMVLRSVLSREVVPIHASADGRVGSRFYLHARNQADALLYLARRAGGMAEVRWHPGVDRPPRYHVVGEREVDNLAMAEMVAFYANRKLTHSLTDFHSSRPGHDLRYALDGTKMELLGWKPPVPLDESLEKTVRWTMDHPHWLSD